MSTLAVVPATSLVNPSAQPAIGGALGLSLHDLQVCGGISRFNDAKQRLEALRDEGEFEGCSCAEISATIDAGTYTERQIVSYVMCVEAAKRFLATLRTDIGRAYRRHLIACEGKAETLDSLISNPANAVKVFQALADQRIALDAMKAVAAHALGALTSSQQNTGAQTRRVHALEAKLLQLDRMMSLAQFFIVSNLKPQHEAASYTAKVRVLLEALGHVPVRQTLANDKWPSWTFKKSWLTDNYDRIAAVVVEVDEAKALAKPKPRNVYSIPPNA